MTLPLWWRVHTLGWTVWLPATVCFALFLVWAWPVPKRRAMVPWGMLLTFVAAVSAAIKDGNTRLEHWETVKKYELIEDEATVANGLLTATLKIRTEEAMKRYEALIEKIYTKPGH